MFNQWLTRVVRGRGRLADLSNKASRGVRWASDVSIRKLEESPLKVSTPSPQRSPWFISREVGHIDFDDAERRLIESYSASAALQAKPVIRSFHRDADQWDMVGPSCRAREISVRSKELVSPG
ncbi:hypothetical protein KCU92_g152, partial [Aureobasidium melanogenum]